MTTFTPNFKEALWSAPSLPVQQPCAAFGALDTSTLSNLVTTTSQGKHCLGWVNLYRMDNGNYIMSAIPKPRRQICLDYGRLFKAQSRYLGTVQLFV